MAARDYEFRFRLFASVDIAGSTAFKRANTRRDATPSMPSWVRTFDLFFEEFPQSLIAQYETDPRTAKLQHRLAVWKYIGDEIVFETLLTDHTDACKHISCFLEAVKSYSSQLRSTPSIRLKASAWCAGFPVGNAEFLLRTTNSQEIRDYIGPSIDLGFRLGSLADDRFVPLSADLAYILLMSHVGDGYSHLRIRYIGRHALRGVGDGSLYPIFVLIRDDELTVAESSLLHQYPQEIANQLLLFLEKFFAHGGGACAKPFIATDPNPTWGTVPDHFQTLRTTLRNDDLDLGYKESERQEAAGGDTIEITVRESQNS